MILQRWDPYRDLRQMEDTVNRLWRGFGGSPSYREGAEDWNILIDVIQKPDSIIVKASIPGVEPDAVDLTVEDNVLTLRAERKFEAEGEEAQFLIQERPVGSFYRAIRLPDTVDASKIQSFLENGVLTIELPKAEEKKKKQIKVQVKSGTKRIEAKKEK
ncbi:MAG: Hsp20/alpha crystallin family protein [Dehalococcoidia bacterium]|nr:MAG: Hsp20/alpha crystallin family protein [Dehalococcoidia bacterium]